MNRLQREMAWKLQVLYGKRKRLTIDSLTNKMETDMPSLSKKAQIDMQREILQVDKLHVQYSKRKYIPNYI